MHYLIESPQQAHERSSAVINPHFQTRICLQSQGPSLLLLPPTMHACMGTSVLGSNEITHMKALTLLKFKALYISKNFSLFF